MPVPAGSEIPKPKGPLQVNNTSLAPSVAPGNDNRCNSNARTKNSHRKYSTTETPLFHGRTWGRWVFDAERLVLVLDGRPGTGGTGDDEYLAYFGIYEVDVELRASSQLLDRIFQVRTLGWVDPQCMSDLLEALHDTIDPQANLCSGGRDKRIEKPAEFLRRKIANVGVLDQMFGGAA